MRLLIYSLNYAPELTGIGKYTGEMCEWLAAKGHEVYVVTAPPYYPAWRVDKGYSAWRYRVEERKGVKVFRCPLWVPAKPSGLKRLLHLASFAASSSPLMIWLASWRPDVVMTVEPPFFCAPAALVAARLCGAIAWLHIQDFEIDAAFKLGLLKSDHLHRIVQDFEGWLLKHFDRLSTISKRMRMRLMDKGVDSARSYLFPNWVDCARIYPVPRRKSLREQLGISSTDIVALYAGNMGEKQGLDIVIEAARSLQHKKGICFVMCGEGAAYSRLRKQANGLGNIHWLSLQPYEKLNQLLNMADIHLLPQRFDAADLVMPSKLTGMLASGRPVLATAPPDSEVGNVLKTAGVVVPPEDFGAFVQALNNMWNDENLRLLKGRNAREYALKHFNVENILAGLESTLKKQIEEQFPKTARA